MNSHNSAIASRTDFPRVASRTVTMQRCRNWAVVLYPVAYSSNASLPNLCMIFFGKPEVAVSQSLIIFAGCTKGFTCRLLAAFPCSLVAMLCLPIEILKECVMPIAYVYTSFVVRSIFLSLCFFSIQILGDTMHTAVPKPPMPEWCNNRSNIILFQEVKYLFDVVVYKYSRLIN